jgi:hypothetical protein
MLLGQGDIGSARIVLERAAETGNAQASFALAETYDPLVLRRWGAYGTLGDAAKARDLYAKAEAGGIKEASEQVRCAAPRHCDGLRAPTDASVSIHRVRDQAAGAASLAPSCQPEPRYSRCGYLCDPMWLRMQARLRRREQCQTGLPLCDADS